MVVECIGNIEHTGNSISFCIEQSLCHLIRCVSLSNSFADNLNDILSGFN
jgi:hypothetical protein